MKKSAAAIWVWISNSTNDSCWPDELVRRRALEDSAGVSVMQEKAPTIVRFKGLFCCHHVLDLLLVHLAK